MLLFEQAHAYYDAMKQAPATQQAVLSVLLDRCLPLLAADCSPETLADARHIHTQLASNLGCAVCSPCLQRELQQRMDQPQAANYIRHALRVVTALPLRRSSAALPGMYGEQHKGSAVLLARLCSPGQRAMLPDSDCVALAWSFVEALPRIAAVVAALAADDGVLAEQLAQICMALQRAAAALLYQGLTAISSGSQLAAWAAACDATLRLAPSLLQLQERCQQLERESWQQAPLLLFHQLLDVAPLAASACDHIDAQGMQSGAAHAQVTRQLWALHTNACRMLAWLAADCSGVRTAALASRPDHGVVMLLELLSDVRYVLLNMAERSVEQGELRRVYCAADAARSSALPWCAWPPQCTHVAPARCRRCCRCPMLCKSTCASRLIAPVRVCCVAVRSACMACVRPTGKPSKQACNYWVACPAAVTRCRT